MLYRIIGNDLPPRHRRGQARENVAFILENEPDLPGCEKRWILNRIVDPEEESALAALLSTRGHEFTRIPFELETYARIGLDEDRGLTAAVMKSGAFLGLQPDERARAEMHRRRSRNNYVTHNNGARNLALRAGREAAKWVMPWDGNCFVTAEAWAEITAAIRAEPHLKYFVVPMARVRDNSVLRAAGYRPEADGEPQVIFRRDAAEEFNEAFPYGRRSKVELLWRLAVPGPWMRWYDDPWDLPRPRPAREAGEFGRAGWVARLSSGEPALEAQDAAARTQRTMARIEGVLGLLDRLDRAATNASRRA